MSDSSPQDGGEEGQPSAGGVEEEGEEEEEDDIEYDEFGEEVDWNAHQEEDLDEAEAGEIDVQSFGELQLPSNNVIAAQEAWRMFLANAASREAAGEAIYAALLEGAPSLQSLFTTPRAVQALRFMNGISSFVTALDNPPYLKILVESLSFGHLHLDVTIPRVVIFRDAILDLLAVDLGDKLTREARLAWTKLLSYVGGAIVYCKAFYAERIICLNVSWEKANVDEQEADATEGPVAAAGRDRKSASHSATASKKGGWFGFSGAAPGTTKGEGSGEEKSEEAGAEAQMGQNIPKTFTQMFQFNAAVMGFGEAVWMNEVLACFNNVVLNVSNSARLQEECDVMALRINKVKQGTVNLAEFKSCMLASLRSLLPADWSTQHEVAWTWLWENVERLLEGSPFLNRGDILEKQFGKFLGSLEEDQKYRIRAEIYARFFSVAPGGQDYFKQSNTYLHMIADKVIEMSLGIYGDPVGMVDSISALGLRHVGYGIPTEFFGPFVTACIEVLQSNTTVQEKEALEAFRWGLGLITKVLVRTITEGSTIVMKAINLNNKKQLQKAIGCAPRGDRFSWMLVVQVGTQSISPLQCAIMSGKVEAAEAMIQDLLTIRADRDRYYYGADDLFRRHPDLIKMMRDEAPILLPTLLDGLIWRSRLSIGGLRRVNYFVHHLIVDPDGDFSDAIEWLYELKDPVLVQHPVVVLLTDLVWTGVARFDFALGKLWLFLTLVVFILGQSIFHTLNDGQTQDGQPPSDEVRIKRNVVITCRILIYGVSLSQLVYSHTRKIILDVRQGELTAFAGFTVPMYLTDWQESCGLLLLLTLSIMLWLEPILACWTESSSEDLFMEVCSSSKGLVGAYSFFSMIGMVLYCVLLVDCTVFSNQVSAYVLVCGQLATELGLCLFALAVVVLMFSSGISALKHDIPAFDGIHTGVQTLGELVLGMFGGHRYSEVNKQPEVVAVLFVFMIVATLFLLNLLVAQLTTAYHAIFDDMVGYARLGRMRIIVDTLPKVSKKRWRRFVAAMQFDKRLEFNEGDVGLAGGVQMLENSSLNPTTEEAIRRYGGSTAASMQWPEEGLDEEDGLDRIEKLMQKALQRLSVMAFDQQRGQRNKGSTQSGVTVEESGGGSQSSSHAN